MLSFSEDLKSTNTFYELLDVCKFSLENNMMVFILIYLCFQSIAYASAEKLLSNYNEFNIDQLRIILSAFYLTAKSYRSTIHKLEREMDNLEYNNV